MPLSGGCNGPQLDVSACVCFTITYEVLSIEDKKNGGVRFLFLCKKSDGSFLHTNTHTQKESGCITHDITAASQTHRRVSRSPADVIPFIQCHLRNHGVRCLQDTRAVCVRVFVIA